MTRTIGLILLILGTAVVFSEPATPAGVFGGLLLAVIGALLLIAAKDETDETK